MSPLRFVLVGLTSLVLGSPSGREEIAFRVAADTTLARTVKNGYSMELESVVLSMNGEELPADTFGEVDIRIEHSEIYVVTDSYEVVEAGKPRRLRRTFDELGGRESSSFASEGDEANDASDYASALEGKVVVFTWDDEAERFEAAYAEGVEGDAALLEELDEDMDLRRLLPVGPTAEGESWSIDPHAFAAVLDPGGDLGLEIAPDDGGEKDEGASVKEAQFRANLAGTLTATFAGTLVEDGVRQARIELVCDTRTHAEQPLGADAISEGTSGTERIEIHFRLEGELRWDLEHGHALAFELSGENRLTSVQTIEEDFEGERFEHAQTMVFAGESSFSMRVERR